eukprot:235552-Chlamydomonas_euryale.AAC.1
MQQCRRMSALEAHCHTCDQVVLPGADLWARHTTAPQCCWEVLRTLRPDRDKTEYLKRWSDARCAPGLSYASAVLAAGSRHGHIAQPTPTPAPTRPHLWHACCHTHPPTPVARMLPHPPAHTCGTHAAAPTRPH